LILEFMQQRRFAREDIALWFGVPPHRLGLSDGSGKTRIEDADQSYVNTIIMPDCEVWEQKFDATFGLSEDGYFLDLDERNLLRASRINTDQQWPSVDHVRHQNAK